MSALASPVRARAQAKALPARPGLRAVPHAQTAHSKTPFVLVCVLILAAALCGVLLLNTVMAQGAYEQQKLTSQLARLNEAGQNYSQQIDAVGSPQRLASAAQALGMIGAPQPAFIRLADQKILGTPTAAK